ncbi:conserved hypothetical protein [Histoplasma capsulatum var. duboisii H88]|nr:conserved hypothetical protein [Histoplasma capsulatum var. duboisii H88]
MILFNPYLMALAIVPGLVSATPAPTSGAIFLRRTPTVQPRELITDAVARLNLPTQHRLNGTTATTSPACAFRHNYNSSASELTAPLAYVNPALFRVGQGTSNSSAHSNSTDLCGASIIVINPLLTKVVAATVAGSCGNCSMYDVELSRAAWQDLAGAGALGGGGGEVLMGNGESEGLKLGSMWRVAQERIGVSVQWIILASPPGPQRQLNDSQNPNMNTTQRPNKGKGRVPIFPGIGQVRMWVSL